jgi:hypothetical protein
VVPIAPASAGEAETPAWIGFEDQEDWSQDASPPAASEPAPVR